jgi:hypothetical protein
MITGFESDIAILLLAVCIIAALALSWWTYSGNTRLPAGVRWTLTGFRALAIIILAVLLFDPVFEFEEERRIKRNIAVLLDNSASLAIEKGSWNGEEDYRAVIRDLALEDTSDVRYNIYGFDRSLFETQADSLPLDGSVTDIHQAFSMLYQEDAAPDAIILLSDGIFNRGLDPTSAASRFDRPVFTLAAGDTSKVRDVLVRNTFYNSTAYTNSTGRIRTEILNDGFPDRSIEVQLYRNGELADVQTIQTTTDRSVHELEFEVDFTEEGSEQFSVQIPEIAEEWSVNNNSYDFTIDVLDDQLRVLHLAFEIHPDVRSLRNLMATDESVLAEHQNWLGELGFSGEGLSEQADTLDLVVLHGFPHQSMSESLRNEIFERFRNNNVLLLTLPGTDSAGLADDFGNLAPIRARASSPTAGLRPVINEAGQNHTVLEIDDIPDLSRGPALRGPVRNFTAAGAARSLLDVRYRGESTGASLLAVQQIGNNRLAQFNAYGWFAWRQSTRETERNFYRDLMNNVVKWTASGVSEGLLEFAPVRSSFDEGEVITFRANLRSETGQPEEDGRINVQVSPMDGSSGVSEQEFVMQHIGNGRYTLEIPALPAGSYAYEAVASRRSEEVARQSGSFAVNESILEFTDIVRRDALLRLIAERTNGAFFTPANADSLNAELSQRGLFEDRREQFESVRRAHRSYWWFLIVLALVGIEWTTRKYYDIA